VVHFFLYAQTAIPPTSFFMGSSDNPDLRYSFEQTPPSPISQGVLRAIPRMPTSPSPPVSQAASYSSIRSGPISAPQIFPAATHNPHLFSPIPIPHIPRGRSPNRVPVPPTSIQPISESDVRPGFCTSPISPPPISQVASHDTTRHPTYHLPPTPTPTSHNRRRGPNASRGVGTV